VVVIRPGSGRAAHWAGWTTCLVIGIAAAAVLVGAVAALVAGGLGAGLAFLQPDSPPGAPREILQPTATEIPSFGGDGIGPGLFTDARSIDVDGQGRIYVGEYQGGRVQVFTPDGTFLTQWHAARDLPLRGLAVTRGGDVILAQGGELMRYNGESGERLGPVTSAAEGFDDIAVTPDGQLLASSTSAGEDALVVLSRDGNPLRVIPNAVSGQTGDSELDVRVAADGQGNLLGLGTFNETVVVFSPEGRYLNRVGSAGDETGQLRAPSSIEVDGRGRIYVGDVDGVEVFHPDGRHLTTLEVDGFPFGLAFAQDGRLLVVNGSRVAWLDVPG
jgi:outer membrane protein assembly factor BamB